MQLGAACLDLANSHATLHHAPTCTRCRLRTMQASKACMARTVKHPWGACMVNATLRQLRLRTAPNAPRLSLLTLPCCLSLHLQTFPNLLVLLGSIHTGLQLPCLHHPLLYAM